MNAAQSWSNLSPNQSEAMHAIMSDYQRDNISADTAIARAAVVLGVPAEQAPAAINALSQNWIEQNRELLDWAGSLAG